LDIDNEARRRVATHFGRVDLAKEETPPNGVVHAQPIVLLKLLKVSCQTPRLACNLVLHVLGVSTIVIPTHHAHGASARE
jgi:hypothetical protein